MEILGTLFFIYIVYIIFFAEPDKSSTSYRLGKGVGKKTKKLGKWIMDD
tara:strand:+ start:4676 stop:4822 length:147 start_codon:yes stop_codon:yes gene_type:complete